MDIRSLQAFVEVATSGGFNRAAANLHTAQSALSRRVARLEDELGTKLLVRTKRGVQLTPAGSLLLEKSTSLLRHFEQVETEILAEAGEPRGELTIGLPPSLYRESTQLVASIRRRFPQLFLRIWVATSVDLRAMLLAGKLDLAVYASSDEDVLVRTQPLFTEPLHLVVPPNDTSEGPVGWDDLADVPLMLTSRPNSVRLLVDAAAARRGLRLNVILEVNDVPLIMYLAAEGLGYSVLPASATTSPAAAALSSREIIGSSLSWVVSHSQERPLSLGASKAIELTIANLRRTAK